MSGYGVEYGSYVLLGPPIARDDPVHPPQKLQAGGGLPLK
jgi:hypothetical protein